MRGRRGESEDVQAFGGVVIEGGHSVDFFGSMNWAMALTRGAIEWEHDPTSGRLVLTLTVYRDGKAYESSAHVPLAYGRPEQLPLREKLEGLAAGACKFALRGPVSSPS